METDAEKIAALKTALSLAMDWARQLPDQYLDGDPQTRRDFLKDMETCNEALKAASH